MKYRIALYYSDEGYSVSVPGLPGCWSQGASEEEAVENIKIAISEYNTWQSSQSPNLLTYCQTPDTIWSVKFERVD